MRYKTWRSRNDTHLHVLCVEGSEAVESLPVAIRNLGPWTGGPEGEVDKLRLPYRILLNGQKFVVIHAHVSELKLENARVHSLHPANADARSAMARARCRSMVG
jgi:hypothetical protein